MRKGWLEVAERIYKEGYEQGFAQGEAERMILITLKLRGIEVPDAVLHRLRACRDLDQLKAWAKRAAHATDAADIFDGDGDCEGHGDIDGDGDGDGDQA